MLAAVPAGWWRHLAGRRRQAASPRTSLSRSARARARCTALVSPIALSVARARMLQAGPCAACWLAGKELQGTRPHAPPATPATIASLPQGPPPGHPPTSSSSRVSSWPAGVAHLGRLNLCCCPSALSPENEKGRDAEEVTQPIVHPQRGARMVWESVGVITRVAVAAPQTQMRCAAPPWTCCRLLRRLR